MQATIQTIHRLHHAGQRRPPARTRAASPHPRAARQQAGPPAPRLYSRFAADVGPKGPDAGARGVRAGGFLPEQVQQVLIASKGLGFSVADVPAGMHGAQLEAMAGLVLAAQAQDSQGGHAGGLRFERLAPPYDPDEQYRAGRLVSTRFMLDGRQELHARNLALAYTVLSAQPWRLLVAGADLHVLRSQRIGCAEIVFPAHCLVHLNLAKGMLHGFDGRLAGICTGLARQRHWGWFGHENRRCDEAVTQGWEGTLLATVDPAQVRLAPDRPVPFALVQHWQHSVPIEKTPDAIAWEIARTTLPM